MRHMISKEKLLKKKIKKIIRKKYGNQKFSKILFYIHLNIIQLLNSFLNS